MGGDTLMKDTDSIAKEMVHMTIAPEGRTYMKKQWVLDPDIESGTKPLTYTGADYIIEETPFVVPNGKWVMEKTLLGGRWSWLVGIGHSELEHVRLFPNGSSEVLYISDKPFGYVCADEENVDQWAYPVEVKPNGRKTLVYARQVHKGELGRGVRTPTLDYVRQPLASHRGSHMKARERRRGQNGWVKLANLGEMTVGYRPDQQVELILGYWQFSGHEFWQNGEHVDQLVDVAFGADYDIKDGTADFMSLTREQFRKECSDTSKVWVRRGFAYTILRLQALGVQPEVLQFA